MENQKTLDEDGAVSNLGKAQNPCDKTLEEARELSSSSDQCFGSVLLSEFSVGENGGGFDAKSRGMEVSNVEVLNRGIDIEKGIEDVEGEIQIIGVKNADVSVPKASSEVNRNVVVVVEKTAVEEDKRECIASQLNDVDPARKIEVSGNGFSLFVEVFGPPDGFIQKDEAVFGKLLLRGDGVLLSSNGENPEVSEIHESMLGLTPNGTIDGVGAQEEAIYNQECEFSKGDLVWVETKTQSWWPGLIFDPSYAPKVAAKPDQTAGLLVKYFGHGSYIWCSPLQLKPFIENFEQMSAQSNSVNFLGAVKKAVDEFGRRVKLQMTCSCILKENQTMVTAPLAGNGGSKETTSVPEDRKFEFGENFVTQFEPANFLTFVKYLAQYGSVPGMLEFAATRNRLSAFYRSIGHRQLPMHQLRGTADFKDGAEDGLKQSGVSVDTLPEKKVEVVAILPGVEKNIVLEKCWSDFSEEGISSRSRNKEGNKDSEVRYGSAEVPDIDICKLASSSVGKMTKLSLSPTTKETKVSTTAYDGGNGGKSEKGYETRERRRSKYLSPPFINLSDGLKKSPEENETEDGKGVSHVVQDINSITGQSVGSPPIVKCSGKKLQKKRSRKTITGHNTSGIPEGIDASSAEMLSELRFAALDCFYPNENRYFDSVERFISGFRRTVFHDKSNHEMELSDQMHLYPGSVGKDAQERSHPLPNVTSKRKGGNKKEIATKSSNTKPTPGFSDVNGNPTSGSFIINFQDSGCLAPDGMSVPKKRKKMAGRTLELLQDKLAVDLPDLNGNCTTPSSVIEDSPATDLITHLNNPELKKRKRSKGAASVRSRTKSIAGLADVNGNNATVGSFLKNVQVMGPCSTQDIAELNNREGMKGAASLCPDSVLTTAQPDTNGNNGEESSFIKDPRQMLSPGGKPEPKKRKRKEKNVQVMGPCSTQNIAELNNMEGMKGAASLFLNSVFTANQPDTHGNNAEGSSFVKDPPQILSPGGKPEPKKTERKEKDLQVMGPCSTQDIADLNNREGMKGAASLCLNNVLATNQPDTNGNNAERTSFAKDPQQMLFPGGKPEPKKRKRKEKGPVDDPKTKVSSLIPDLNGNVAEPSALEKNLPEMNSTPAEGKPQRKRKIRSKPVAWMPEINFHNKVQTNGEALGTALFLKFAQEFPVPSKEALVTAFCGFGPLNESETQALDDSGTVQVIFANSSDARNAFRSLEKSSPFGPALVNYRLHLSAASRALEADTDLHMGVTFQTMDQFKNPAKPHGLKPHTEEAPDLSYIRKNLEMMTTMLEKAGDNLSPDTRAKLENDIKGLMKKVSTMVGSSSSS